MKITDADGVDDWTESAQSHKSKTFSFSSTSLSQMLSNFSFIIGFKKSFIKYKEIKRI